MAKPTTIVKRMFKDSIKPVAYMVLIVGGSFGTSLAADHFLGWNAEAVYWGVVFMVFFGTGLKWFYDWKKFEIEWEQKQMMKDLSKGAKQ